jgi:hypothetical protein
LGHCIVCHLNYSFPIYPFSFSHFIVSFELELPHLLLFF